MNNAFAQGLVLTVVGMGLVFAILALLWGIMALMARLAGNGGDDPVDAAAMTEPAPVIVQATAGTDEQAVAAIAAALAILRAEHEARAALPWRLPPVLTRWLAIGYGRQLHRWQPRRTRRDA